MKQINEDMKRQQRKKKFIAYPSPTTTHFIACILHKYPHKSQYKQWTKY